VAIAAQLRRHGKEYAMNNAFGRAATANPAALRLAGAIAATFAAFLAIIIAVRPDMMMGALHMAMDLMGLK
jgi:hypothetical protein